MSSFIFGSCMGMAAARLFLLGEYLYCIAVIIAYICYIYQRMKG